MKSLRNISVVSLIALLVCLLAAPIASAAIAIDATTSKDQPKRSSTVTTSPFSTGSGNQLLLAFIAADNVSATNSTVTAVAGAGLTWTLVRQTNTQRGTAEVWRTFSANPLNAVSVTATLSQSVHSSITLMSFSRVDPSGTNGSG